MVSQSDYEAMREFYANRLANSLRQPAISYTCNLVSTILPETTISLTPRDAPTKQQNHCFAAQ